MNRLRKFKVLNRFVGQRHCQAGNKYLYLVFKLDGLRVTLKPLKPACIGMSERWVDEMNHVDWLRFSQVTRIVTVNYVAGQILSQDVGSRAPKVGR